MRKLYFIIYINSELFQWYGSGARTLSFFRQLDPPGRGYKNLSVKVRL